MNNFLLYLLKSTLCISLLYFLFRAMMRKETFFSLNRMLVLTIVLSSAIIPLLYLPTVIKAPVQMELLTAFDATETKSEALPMTKVEHVTEKSSVITPISKGVDRKMILSVWRLLPYLYIAGFFIGFLILIHGLVSVLLLFRKAQSIKMDGFRLLVINREMAAFSFGHFVVISQQDYQDHRKAILIHEQTHIRLNHFYDLLFLEIVRIFHWFNPVIYWLIRDMKEIHEFQADDCTLTKGIDATQYQLLIIQKCVGSQKFALANSFNHCQIKKRIAMINKQKSSKARSWKAAAFLPLLALLLMAFGRKGENEPPESVGLSSIVQDIKKDPVKQWAEADFSTIDQLNSWTRSGKLQLNSLVHSGTWSSLSWYGFSIRIDSKSNLWFNQSFLLQMKELSDSVRKYFDYDYADGHAKQFFHKITINDQVKMMPCIFVTLQSDQSTPPSDYQKFLNTVGNTILEIRVKNSKDVFDLDYSKLNSEQRDQIDMLVPLIVRFGKSPKLRRETIENQPSLYIEVRAEGIIISQEKQTASLDELRNKVELFMTRNPKGMVSVLVSPGMNDEKLKEIKEVIRNANALNVNYSTFDPVYVVAEEMPKFPGGEMALREWINKNLKYPEEAKSKGIEGKIFVNFVVNSKGKTVNAKIARGLSPELDLEAINVVNQIPDWTPGKQKGIPVSVACTVPIKFSLK